MALSGEPEIFETSDWDDEDTDEEKEGREVTKVRFKLLPVFVTLIASPWRTLWVAG
jgi:hypothetical protein